MEDKVLIKGEMDKDTRAFFHVLMIILFSVSVIMTLTLCKKEEYGRYYKYTRNGFERAFNGDGGALTAFIISCSLFLIGIVVGVIYLAHRNCEITVTEKNVIGKTLWGKEVVLPIYMVSAYSTRPFLSTIVVATSSGLTKFTLIDNYTEVGNVLLKMINARQDNTAIAENQDQPTKSGLDDLIKLKNLLDQDIITQEEFDAKKKQLLGL